MDSPSGVHDTSGAGSVEPPRRCLACGYDLRGLGEDLRCPECGLRNIPSVYRQQVWDLVDSGRWFFSGFFTPFRKRLPGWWWALDRPGDVRRSFKFAARHAMISGILILGFGFVADSVVVETTSRFGYVLSRPTGQPGYSEAIVYGWGALGRLRYTERHDISDSYSGRPGATPATTTRVLFAPSAASLVWPSIMWMWALLVWGIPTSVGLCTQIRKGMPPFARPPSTILAAANCEAHRLTYLAGLLSLAISVECVLRCMLWASNYGRYHDCITAAKVLVMTLGMLGWAGPLRSDYTAQLIRSRWHGIRIALMYALVLPAALAFTLVQALEFFVRR